jgi:hypothetical protein
MRRLSRLLLFVAKVAVAYRFQRAAYDRGHRRGIVDGYRAGAAVGVAFKVDEFARAIRHVQGRDE